jgi:hypothetical protein
MGLVQKNAVENRVLQMMPRTTDKMLRLPCYLLHTSGNTSAEIIIFIANLSV